MSVRPLPGTRPGQGSWFLVLSAPCIDPPGALFHARCTAATRAILSMPAPTPEGRPPSPELQAFLAAYDPAVSALALQLRALVLAQAPQATELLYDSYNAVALAFSFSGRLAEAFCHVAVYPRHVNLGFNRGAELPDPEGLLQGSGKRIRHLKIRTIEDLESAHLRRLLQMAVAAATEVGGGVDSQAGSVVRVTSTPKRRSRREA